MHETAAEQKESRSPEAPADIVILFILMSSAYTVRYAPQALDDLRDLYSYVAFSLKEPATAQKLVNRIRKAARSLDALPGRHPVVDWEPWQSMGMHRFTVEDFLLFYLIDQSTRTVTLVRMVYGGRDLQNLAK